MSDEQNNSEQNPYNQSRSNQKKSKSRGKLFICLFILLVIIASAGYVAVDKFLPNFELIPLHSFFEGMDKNKIYIVLGNERIDVQNHPVIKNDIIYIPVDFVKEYIDSYIFWDDTVGRLTVTTENKVIQMKTDDLAYYINTDPFNLSFPVYNIDNVAYIPDNMLMDLYNISIEYDEQYNIAIIDYLDIDRQISEIIAKKTNLRYEPNIKSPIETKLEKTTLVTSYKEENNFTKVRTESGLIGYVKTEDILENSIIPAFEKLEVDSIDMIEPTPIDGKINIIWDQIYDVNASSNLDRVVQHSGIDVISPTWFSFDDETLNGDIINIADKSYVDFAHEKGYQVWALITDNFSYEVSHAILSDTNIREYVTKQLLAFVSMYDLDGINIDFENIGEDDADYYIQFLRELYPLLKQQGITLSVDLKVPKPYSMYYNRTEVAKTSDYIIIMGYDEHYSTSPVSGSVASIGFVEDGVAETLKEAPKEKTILALPYYNRVWREIEQDGELLVKSKAYSMGAVLEMFELNGAEFTWLDGPANYYAEYIVEEEGESVKYKVWLEDERSLEEKLKVAEKYDLAGIAGWSSAWIKTEAEESFLDLVEDYTKK